MAMPAVSRVATQGASVLRALGASTRGSRPSSASCDRVRDGTRQRLQRAVEHVEHHEPDRRRLGEAAEQRRERRPQLLRPDPGRAAPGPSAPSQTMGSTMK